jgi:hypothetical protein
LVSQRFDQITQVFLVHADRAIRRVQKSAGWVWAACMHYQHVPAIRIGGGRHATHGLQDDQTHLAKGRRGVGGSPAGRDNPHKTIAPGRCISVWKPGIAGGIPVFTGGKVVGSATHCERANQPPTGIIVHNEPAYAIAIRRKNNVYRWHDVSLSLLRAHDASTAQYPLTIFFMEKRS